MKTCDFDATVPMEKNFEDLEADCKSLIGSFSVSLRQLRAIVAEYFAEESFRSEEFTLSRRKAMLTEWQDNLFRLNDAINRRIGTLKDMECDLEETIRLTLVQHETEAAVFEQQTCSNVVRALALNIHIFDAL